MNVNHFGAALVLSLCIACATNERKSAVFESAKPTDTTATVAPATTSTPEPITANDDEIKEMGLLKEVEDSGYPYAVLTIEFLERKFTEQFVINLEEVKSANLSTLSGWVGRYVSFTYTSELINALLDIQKDGKSLLGDNAPTLAADTKQIMGKLRGANKETTSDEPGTISITTNDNTTEKFSYFVTKEMVAANGSIVVGYFEERGKNTIKSIKVLPK